MQNNKPTTNNIAWVDDMLKPLQFTQAEIQEFNHLEARHFVCGAFGWDEHSFFDVVYNNAFSYLLHYCKSDSILMERFLKSPLFWAWWQNVYFNIDVQFMQQHGEYNGIVVNTKQLYDMYLKAHSALELAKEIYPGPFVWKEINRGGYK